MFKLSHKVSILRAAILGSIVMAVITFVILFINNNRDVTNAATADGETVHASVLNNGAKIFYGYDRDDPNDPDMYTRWYQITSNEKTFEAFCAEPPKAIPAPNNWPAQSYETNSKTNQYKLLFYLWEANDPEAAELEQAVYGSIYTSGRWGSNSDEKKRYVFTHAVIGKMFDNSEMGLCQGSCSTNPSTGYNQVMNAISVLNNAVTNSAYANIMRKASAYKLYITNTSGAGGVQKLMWIEPPENIGVINITKCDAEITDSCGTQGRGNFNNIVFSVYDGNTLIESKTLSSGAKTAQFTGLTLGKTYTVKESGSNTYYNVNAADQTAAPTSTNTTIDLTFKNSIKRGNLTVKKIDSDTGTCTPSGSASLAGTVFKLINKTGGRIKVGNQFYENNAEIATQTLQAGSCSVAFNNLPYGDYQVTETASVGYSAQTSSQNITVNMANEELTFSNTSDKGSITIQKKDSTMSNVCETSGAASFVGATFRLYNQSGQTIYYNGSSYANGAAISTLSITSGCGVTFAGLPFGTYSVVEIAGGNDYETNSTPVAGIIINQSNRSATRTITNNPKTGSVRIKKQDSATGSCHASGAAILTGTNGASFELVNKNANPIKYNGTTVQPNAVFGRTTMTDTTNCELSLTGIPYGSYIIREYSAGTGYNKDASEKTFTINNTAPAANLTSTPFSNTPKLGKIRVHKVDSELKSQTGANECKVNGNASFKNTSFQLINDNGKTIYIGSNSYANGAAVATQTISTDSGCTVEFTGVPYGTYSIKETAVGSGYSLSTATVAATINDSITDLSVAVSKDFENAPLKGKITVDKKDSSTGTCTTVGNAVFTGVKFAIINRSNNPITYNGQTYAVNAQIAEKTLNVIDCKITFDNLPYGTYDIKETATNASYQANTTVKTVNIPTNNSINVSTSFTNSPVLGRITVNKKDSSTGTCTTVGDTTFNGTTFKITNNSTNPVYYNGQSYAKGVVIDTKPLNTSNCTTVFENLPYGSYIVEEATVGSGYNLNSTPQTISIPANNNTNVSVTFTNSAILGNIAINKHDEYTGSCTPVGDATLAGTSFELYNRSANPVYYNNHAVAKDALIDTITIDPATCKAEFKNLPYGKYEVREKTASTGYHKNEAIHNVTIPTNNNINVADTYTNSPILGKVTIVKTDEHTGTCTPEGDATLAGTSFKLYNKSTNPVYYDNRVIAKDALIDTITIDPATCKAEFNNLPYGRYEVREENTSYGYHKNEAIHNVAIPTNDNVNVTDTYANSPILGKLTVNKIDTDTGTCTNLRGLSFKGATFNVTNESANPIYYIDHFVAKGQTIVTKVLDNDQCSFEVDGLPYGTYKVTETEASKGYVADEPKTVQIPGDSSNVLAPAVATTVSNQPIRGDLKFIKQDPNNERPLSNAVFSITQVFTEGDDPFQLGETHIVVTNEEGVIDTSSSFILHTQNTNGYDPLYDEVEPPLSYLGYGTWFGQDENGVLVPARNDVGALPYGRYIIQELRCDANLFCTGVLNEKITVKIDSHGETVDLGDWDNACTKFALATEAEDAKDGDRYIEANKDATIVDTISYCVKANVDFRIVGVLMDKETRAPLLINGEQVTNEVKVRLPADPELIQDANMQPPSYCSETKMSFNLDASEIAGKELVVFETLYYKDNVITEHHDFDDDSQTVNIVSMGTYAENSATGDKLLPLDEDADIKDTIKYCLKPGQEYTLKGTVMDKETGNGLLVNSELVEEEITFTPEEACGEIEMHFKFNTANLGGKDLVVFEELYLDGHLIIKHGDINDQNQTVSVIPPIPDTGSFSNGLFGGSNGGVNIIIIAGAAVATGLGGYGIHRRSARKKFLNRF